MRRFDRIVWMLVILICGFCYCPKAEAAKAYKVVEEEEGLKAYYGETELRNTRLAVKEKGNAYVVVKPNTKDSEIYEFDQDGIGTPSTKTGFVKISYKGKKNEYFLKDGELKTNQIAGNKKQGYDYVDKDGIRVKDKTIRLAVKFVRAHTKASDSRSEKLKKCYYYLSKNYKYTRYYTNLYPKAKDMKSMAHDMLSKKTGNCHRYAASFAYIARVLGYDGRVVVGMISSSRGGMTPHGWTEIKDGKYWYVCDPDMEMNGVASYMKTSTPCRTSVTRRCTMTIKDGKVIWK